MNPITALLKYKKSAPIIDNVEKEFKTMTTSNWRTNVHGILIGCLMLASIWAPPTWQSKIQDTEMAFIAMGLLSAADAANIKKQ